MKCLPVRMSAQPVVVTKMLQRSMQSSTVVTYDKSNGNFAGDLFYAF